MSEDGRPVCIVLGGGGHARVLIDSLQASEVAVIHGVLDPNRSLWGETLLGVPVLGGDDLLPGLFEQGVTHFVVGLGSIGNSHLRARLFEAGLSRSLKPLTVMHPSAICSVWAKIGDGSQLFPASVVNANASLGENSIINSGAIVEHDCLIGAHTHIATGAKLSGGVKIGAGAHVGAGAVIRQDINIGAGAIIGAGACVIRDVEPETIVVGVPAQPLARS